MILAAAHWIGTRFGRAQLWTMNHLSEKIGVFLFPYLFGVMPMSQIIRCPNCRRRLRFSADLQTDLARCPACETTFPLASASATSESVQTTLPPPQPASRRRPNAMPRSRRNPCLIVALVIGGVLLIMGAGTVALVAIAWSILQPSPINPAARTEETEAERQEQMRQAFKDRKPPTDQEIAQQVQRLLNGFSAAIGSGMPARIMGHLDLDRMLDEIADADKEALPPFKNAKERNAFLGRETPWLHAGMDRLLNETHWNAIEIRNIKKRNNDEAVVIARHKVPNGAWLKLRWWVTRRNGDWKIYDFEDLDMARRVSSDMALWLGRGGERAMKMGPAVQNIIDSMQAVEQGDLDGAEQKLAQARGVQLPPRFESMHQLANGMLLLHRGKFADALKALDEAHRLHPDLPIADFLRGMALSRLGKAGQALKYLYAYRDLVGDDAQVCREIAEVLRTKVRWAEAAKEYRKALACNPKDEELFAELASLLFQEDEDDSLQKILEVRAKDLPGSIEIARFRYRLLIRQNKTTEGMAQFKLALAKENNEKRRAQLTAEFLTDMQAADKFLEGYQAAPDAVAAFQQLASGLFANDRWDDLGRLLEAHRVGHAEDPWLAYYQAQVYQHDEAWEKAAKLLSAALKNDAKAARESIQADYVFVLYKMGHWQQAYAQVEPHNKTFVQLANLMANDKKAAELEALIRAHGPHGGDNPDVSYYEARAKALMKKWSEAVPLFRQAYQKQTDKILRANYQSSFLLDLAAEGRWHEGYQAAVDKGAALNTLAGRLLAQKKDKELAALLEEHRKSGAGEPWYSFYLGELHLLRGDARQAAQHFAVALAKGKPEDQWRLRDGLFRARVEAGEAMLAYAEQKANEGTFGSLAHLCSRKKDTKQLQALLDAHCKIEPDEPSLVAWELELLWLKHDYEEALRLLTRDHEDVFTQPLFRWKAEDCRVRCLVKLKRREEAVRAAEEIVRKRSGDHLLLVLAHAAGGDVPQTIAAMGKLGKEAFFVRRCYEDEDLGPILRSKEFQAFRAKFPEPKEDRAASD